MRVFPIFSAAIILAACAVLQWLHPPTQPLAFLTLIFVTLVVCTSYMMNAARLAGEQHEPWVDSEIPDGFIDPWLMQEALMKASGQPIAPRPALTNTGVLYCALTMEELGETLEALLKPLESMRNCQGVEEEARTLARALSARFLVMSDQLQVEAQVLRRMLAMQEFHFEMSDEEAEPILDGTTDVTVTNCGLALAFGFDGARAYYEVAGSNLSKRNPETGLIDKTPDGKWIKGPKYRAPNLAAVLRETAKERGQDPDDRDRVMHCPV